MSAQFLGVLFSQLNAFCAGLHFATGEEVLREISPWRFAALCYAIAAPVNTLWWWLTRIGILPRTHKHETEHHEGAHGGRATLFLLLHTASSAIGYLLMWLAMDHLLAVIGALLSRAEMLIAVVLGFVLLREVFTRWQWVGFALAICGIVVIRLTDLTQIGHADDNAALGYILMLSSAIFFGLTEVTGKVAVKYMPVPKLVVIRAWIMLAFLALCWLVMDPGWTSLSGHALLWLVVSGLAGPVLARNNYMLAMSYLPVSQVALLNQTQVVYTALIAFTMRGEVPGNIAIIGGALLIGGLMFVASGKGKKPPKC